MDWPNKLKPSLIFDSICLIFPSSRKKSFWSSDKSWSFSLTLLLRVEWLSVNFEDPWFLNSLLICYCFILWFFISSLSAMSSCFSWLSSYLNYNLKPEKSEGRCLSLIWVITSLTIFLLSTPSNDCRILSGFVKLFLNSYSTGVSLRWKLVECFILEALLLCCKS